MPENGQCAWRQLCTCALLMHAVYCYDVLNYAKVKCPSREEVNVAYGQCD